MFGARRASCANAIDVVPRACQPQIFFQFKFFLPDPIANDVKYQAAAQPFLVFGLLTTGLAIGHANSLGM